MNKIRSLEKRMDQGKKSSDWLENHLVVNKIFFLKGGRYKKGVKVSVSEFSAHGFSPHSFSIRLLVPLPNCKLLNSFLICPILSCGSIRFWQHHVQLKDTFNMEQDLQFSKYAITDEVRGMLSSPRPSQVPLAQHQQSLCKLRRFGVP